MEPDIIVKIKKDFNKNSDLAVQYIIDFETKNKLSSRISRCIIILSNGNLDKLKENIKMAETDWRDVIFHAEEKPLQYESPF